MVMPELVSPSISLDTPSSEAEILALVPLAWSSLPISWVKELLSAVVEAPMVVEVLLNRSSTAFS
ncbi:hypothetical protein D3C81_2132410 [compost metagenome]